MPWEATPERILRLVPARARARALALALADPERSEWKAFLESTLLALGTLLSAAGVIYFVAYNWSSLDRFSRFAMLEVVLVGCFWAAGRLGLETAPGRWALTLAALLIGPLLALYGQVYHLQADSWRLFAGWAGLMLPWVLAAAHPPLWLALWAVVNVAWQCATSEWLLLGLANLAWWGVAQALARRWPSGAWTLRASAVACLGYWTLQACAEILDETWHPSLLLALVTALAVLRHYRGERRQGLLLTTACGSLIACATCGLARLLVGDDSVPGLLTLLALLVGQLSLAVGWLRREMAP